jgi:protein-tyrosine phosphatase
MAERHLALEGCLNLRDIGGYRTADRREVRWGCLYRSSELCSLTDADLAAVERLGLAVVVDLRNPWERAVRPSRLPPGVEVIERWSPSSGNGPGPRLEEQIPAGDLPGRDDDHLAQVYVDILERFAPEIRVILETAVDAVERPLLFHCAAGKDRTGMVAAVLLGVLGVPHATIVEDYELTTTFYGARRLDDVAKLLADHGVSPEQVRHLVEARTPAFEEALHQLHDRWGGYDGYATTVLGVAPDLPAHLRATLTVPGS